MNVLQKLTSISSPGLTRSFTVSALNNAKYSCKLLVVGGGSGGCAIAAKFARHLKKDEVYILEPSEDHYFQPLWTLVGAGVKTVSQTRRQMKDVLPTKAKWLKDAAVSIEPKSNLVKTREGHEIQYEYLVVCAGLQNDYGKVPGLTEALKHPASGVSTIYAADYCSKTWSDLKSFKGGEVMFTYPDTPIKCPGAPQKIAYLADAYLRMSHVRSKSNLTYNTCLPVIFGVKKYAETLLKVVERKNIHVNYKTVLKEVRQDKKEAVFRTTDDNKAQESTIAYYMKKDLFPFLYWQFMVRGYYNGPEFVRRIINPLAK
ncbi:hypothetical protein evm_005771 [Chilo suppressalis]|nr:hypothetical protein evm_005771 [Chilo suppressalis]